MKSEWIPKNEQRVPFLRLSESRVPKPPSTNPPSQTHQQGLTTTLSPPILQVLLRSRQSSSSLKASHSYRHTHIPKTSTCKPQKRTPILRHPHQQPRLLSASTSFLGPLDLHINTTTTPTDIMQNQSWALGQAASARSSSPTFSIWAIWEMERKCLGGMSNEVD